MTPVADKLNSILEELVADLAEASALPRKYVYAEYAEDCLTTGIEILIRPDGQLGIKGPGRSDSEEPLTLTSCYNICTFNPHGFVGLELSMQGYEYARAGILHFLRMAFLHLDPCIGTRQPRRLVLRTVSLTKSVLNALRDNLAARIQFTAAGLTVSALPLTE